MLLALLASATAQAACPDLGGRVDAAWAAFADAEIDTARGILKVAIDTLDCHTVVVDRDALVRLYHLDAAVSLALGDGGGAEFGCFRSVAVDPERAPDEVLGPELAELHARWVSRLARNLVDVTLQDGGEGWVDGAPLTARVPLSVVAGEHLLQLRGHDGFSSEVVDISAPYSVFTGVALETERPPRKRGVARRVTLLTGGGLLVAGGVASLVIGWQAEQAFLDDPYDGSYGGCAPADACWADARDEAIRADAKRIRTWYLVGYGATAAGVVVGGLELLVLPRPAAGGAILSVRGRLR